MARASNAHCPVMNTRLPPLTAEEGQGFLRFFMNLLLLIVYLSRSLDRPRHA